MVSAILMAGYNNKWEVKRYAKVIAEHYGEKFIETGYKPLREFMSIENDRKISKPLIQQKVKSASIRAGAPNSRLPEAAT